MSDLAGQLQIALVGREVSLGSTRPLGAARVFVGRPVTTVVRQLPLLFSLCAQAQTIACARAAEQALGRDAGPGREQARARLLAAETTKEHLWRLLLDWPGALAGASAPDAGETAPVMGAVLRAFGEVRTALAPWALTISNARDDDRAPLPAAAATLADLARRVAFGMDPTAWLAAMTTPNDLLDWAARQGTDDPLAAALLRDLVQAGLAGLGRNTIPALPSLTSGGTPPLPVAAFLDQQLAAPGAEAFIAAPTWHGAPRETTPLARLRDWPLIAALVAAHGNGLLARLAALLVELARCCEVLVGPAPEADSQPAPGPAGTGLAGVEAARGLLVHRLVLDGERVADYRILAPTEWNFHPAGVVAAGLAAIATDLPDVGPAERTALLRRQAALHITAVDPCVDYALSVS